MFSGCTSITYIDLSKISFSQTDDMSFMFNDCTSVTSIEFKQAIYNNGLDINMESMFNNCKSLQSLDLKGHF